MIIKAFPPPPKTKQNKTKHGEKKCTRNHVAQKKTKYNANRRDFATILGSFSSPVRQEKIQDQKSTVILVLLNSMALTRSQDPKGGRARRRIAGKEKLQLDLGIGTGYSRRGAICPQACDPASFDRSSKRVFPGMIL